jgi:predicted RNA methylase
MGDQPVQGIHDLVSELTKRLTLGEFFDNPKLTQIADQAFGGTRAQGVFTPRDAYDALETAVNKHLLETEAQVLMSMNAEAFASLSALADRLATQTDRTLEQTEFQQFSTPPTLAFLAAKLLDLQPGDIVLEPSAGTGSLAIWPRSFGARVVCNEINPRRRALLTTELGFETYDVDAEIIDDVLPSEIRPTLVLMNPPFTATGGRVVQHHAKYGLRHIESALRRLSEGGRLVAIAGENVAFQRSAVTGWWQKMAATYNVRANFGLTARGRTEKSGAVIKRAARGRWFLLRASGGRAQRYPRNGLPQAQQKAQKEGKHLPSTVVQLARRARTQQFAQDQAQIERAHVDQLPLQNVFVSAQMATPHPARLVAVREAALD